MSRKQYVDFIESSGLKLIQINQRPWGSYQLAMSYNGREWFNDGEVFGWGYSTHEAAIAIFEKYINQPQMDKNFYMLIGPILMDKLVQIVKNPEPDVEPILVEPLKLLPPRT